MKMDRRRTPADWQKALGRWRTALMAATALTPTIRLVGLVMLEAANRETYLDTGNLVSWLGVDRIAASVGITPRAVRQSRERLAGVGIIRIDDNAGGRARPAVCAFRDEWLQGVEAKDKNEETDCRVSAPKPGTAVPPIAAENTEQKFRLSKAKPGKYRPKPGTGIPKTRNGDSSDSLEEPLDEPHEGNIPAAAELFALDERQHRSQATKSDDDVFEAFWTAYPRKIGKGAARRAFKTAVKKITLAELMAAVERFAKQRLFEDPNFTPHASTWLNGERWTDEPSTGDHEHELSGHRPGQRHRHRETSRADRRARLARAVEARMGRDDTGPTG